MKVFRIICAAVLSVSMFAYMMLAGALFAVDISLDENYIQNALKSSDALSELVRSAELAIYDELEENAEDIVESFGGDPQEVSDVYNMPEATALFADIFTGCARFILYGEEYTEVSEELVKDYLCAAVNYGTSHTPEESELEDYLAVRLDSYTASFNRSVSGFMSTMGQESEMLSMIRFVFRDIKLIAIVAAVVHMLILILLIRGKIGYFANAAVFGVSGVALFAMSGSLQKSLEGVPGAETYSNILAEIFKGRFQLVGAILFVVCTVLVVLALAMTIRKKKSEETA